jgi:hypothetical protein
MLLIIQRLDRETQKPQEQASAWTVIGHANPSLGVRRWLPMTAHRLVPKSCPFARDRIQHGKQQITARNGSYEHVGGKNQKADSAEQDFQAMSKISDQELVSIPSRTEKV